MSLFKMFARTTEDFAKYRGDAAFLPAAAAATALVINADGSVEDAEINAALKGLMNHEFLSTVYKGSEIEEALNKAIVDSKTRAGKLALARALESTSTRKREDREDIFMIAADTADIGGIGDDEKRVLLEIAKTLSLDGAKLLGM